MQQDAPLTLLSTFDQYYPQREPLLTLQAPGYDAWIAALPTEDGRFSLACADRGGKAVFTWQTARDGKGLNKQMLPPWAVLPAGVIVKLCAEGMDVNGFSAAILSGEKTAGPRFDMGIGAVVAALVHALHGRGYTQATLVGVLDAVRRDAAAAGR
ncbi:MAG: hypothetical protein IPK52_12095 [Chloroflexi bacterium]|nr:hypothetical protein [Chloroflexota bacterium]